MVALAVSALASRRSAERAATVISAVVALVGRVLRRAPDPLHTRAASSSPPATPSCRSWCDAGDSSRPGTLGYGLLQALLLWACLDAVGAALAPAVVLAGYAVDRVVSMITITPGGTGFAEAGTAAVLIALGGDPAQVAAGVLLYRGFTFALEIPVGGAWLLGWLFQRRRTLATVRQAG